MQDGSMIERESLPKSGKRIKLSNSRLSREEKIRVLAAIQEFGIGTVAYPEMPVQDMDQLYRLANKWKVELERSIFKQKEDNVVFISFGQQIG